MCLLPAAEPTYKDVVVLGCGNILFGDDGFGTHVADHLEREGLIPSHVSVINAGTGVREILFDLVISDQRPRKVIVIDAVDKNRRPRGGVQNRRRRSAAPQGRRLQPPSPPHDEPAQGTRTSSATSK